MEIHGYPKQFILVRAAPGIAKDEFYRYWTERHAPIILGVPGYATYRKRWVQNIVSAAHPGGLKYDHDGLTEIWVTGVPFAEDAIEYYKTVVGPDEARFSESSATRILRAAEHEILPPGGNTKVITLLAARPGRSIAEFEEMWRIHGEDLAKRPEVRGVARNVLDPTSDGDFAGLEMLWFDSPEIARASMSDPAFNEVRAAYSDQGSSRGFVAREHLAYEGAP